MCGNRPGRRVVQHERDAFARSNGIERRQVISRAAATARDRRRRNRAPRVEEARARRRRTGANGANARAARARIPVVHSQWQVRFSPLEKRVGRGPSRANATWRGRDGAGVRHAAGRRAPAAERGVAARCVVVGLRRGGRPPAVPHRRARQSHPRFLVRRLPRRRRRPPGRAHDEHGEPGQRRQHARHPGGDRRRVDARAGRQRPPGSRPARPRGHTRSTGRSTCGRAASSCGAAGRAPAAPS